MWPERIIPLALVLMALLFFFPAIAPLTDSVLRDLGVPPAMSIPVSSAIWNHYLLGLISLCGGIAFLLWTRRENPAWYLGIPLVLAFAVIVVAPFAGALFVIHDPSSLLYFLEGIGSLLSACGTLFLPPCAALLFWSQRHLGRGVTVITGAALVITLSAIIFVLYILFFPGLVAAGLIPPAQPQYIDGHLVKSEMGWAGAVLFLILQYIGPLVIGICFLVLAALSWRGGRRAGRTEGGGGSGNRPGGLTMSKKRPTACPVCGILLLLALMAMVPAGSAGDDICAGQTHCIPPEYFANAKPAEPLPESAMITLVISQQTFSRFRSGQPDGIVGIPLTFLENVSAFSNTTAFPTWHYERDLDSSRGVFLVRMPESMYRYLVATRNDSIVSFPESSFVRQYNSLPDLEAQVTRVNETAEIRADTTPLTSPPVLPAITVTTTRTPAIPAAIPATTLALGCIAILALGRRK